MLAGYPPAMGAHAALGSVVADAEMPLFGSQGRIHVLAGSEASVIVFFRPDQERSRTALRELHQCRQGLAGKSARWVGVVPDAAPAQSLEALLSETGFDVPVAIDSGDAFYGSLGLSLHPVVVIVDRDRRLAAFEPFLSVDFCTVVSARLRHVLREISDDELRAALSPPAATTPGKTHEGRRYRILAQALFRVGNLEKAGEQAMKSLERDPDDVESHVLLGRILEAKGDCAAATRAFDKALALDKSHAAARNGLGRCAPAR